MAVRARQDMSILYLLRLIDQAGLFQIAS
jgi:hypothetical protein